MGSSGAGDAPGWGKGDAQEGMERMTSLARGAKGEPGERGERGLSRVQGRAVVFLFALCVAGIVVSLLWTAHEVNSNAAAQRSQQAAQQRQAAAEQAAQQRSAAAVGAKLCTMGAKLAALKPPAGNPLTNPSRAYLQQQAAVLAGLGPDLGCKP
jgi:hypothetical protein